MITEYTDQLKYNTKLIKETENNLETLKVKFNELKFLCSQIGNDENFNKAIRCFYIIFSYVPLMATKLDYGISLFRSRPHYKKNETFTKVSEISYNQNLHLIRQGRFNQEGESMFYAALPVNNDLMESNLVACLETCKRLTELPTISIKDFTIGKWEIKQAFYVVNFCMDEEHLKTNFNIKKQFDDYIKTINEIYSHSTSTFILEFYQYFSELSGKRLEMNNNYFILIALFISLKNYYKNKTPNKVEGLIYPSAMSEKKGLNIVLTPEIVNNSMNCEKVGMYRFRGMGKSYSAEPCCEVSTPTEEGYFQIQNHYTINNEEFYEPEC